jgi:hypothetical protein
VSGPQANGLPPNRKIEAQRAAPKVAGASRARPLPERLAPSPFSGSPGRPHFEKTNRE